MLGFGWLAIRQAQEALQNGRLDEAHRLLREPSAQGHKGTWDMMGQIAQGICPPSFRRGPMPKVEQLSLFTQPVGDTVIAPLVETKEATRESTLVGAILAFHDEMMKIAREKGAGWVDYWLPKPGQTEPSHKWSYVKAVKAEGGSRGCGIFCL